MSERPAAPAAGDWVREVFPTAELARGSALLPVGSRRREFVRGAAVGVLDRVVALRQRAMRVDREVEAAAARSTPASVLIAGVYRPDGVEDMAAAVRELRRSKHRLRFAFGATETRWRRRWRRRRRRRSWRAASSRTSIACSPEPVSCPTGCC